MKSTSIAVLALLLGACGQQAGDPEPAAPVAAQPAQMVYEKAVANEKRPEADRARDAGRKPAEVLEFLGIAPGMTVLDMFSGGGYYTEILSHLVGSDGHIIAQTNQAYLGFVGDEFENRYLGGRLENTGVLLAENNELSLKPGSIDAVLLVLSFHDLYYVAPDDGWPAFDVEMFLAELHKGLKAGGVVGIVDHYAAEGSPRETGGTTHRIDPAIVKEAMTAAGFTLDGQSDVLRNPDDDYDKIVFDAELRGKTDRFVMRWVRAE